jgi:hypothetical protein
VNGVGVVVGFCGVVFVVGGADCVPEVPLAEAADCCTCLADTRVDGEGAGFGDGNCLPDDPDTTRGVASAEEQACAAGAGDAINGENQIFVEPACLDAPHPCADVCGRANVNEPIFVDAT